MRGGSSSALLGSLSNSYSLELPLPRLGIWYGGLDVRYYVLGLGFELGLGVTVRVRIRPTLALASVQITLRALIALEHTKTSDPKSHCSISKSF